MPASDLYPGSAFFLLKSLRITQKIIQVGQIRPMEGALLSLPSYSSVLEKAQLLDEKSGPAGNLKAAKETMIKKERKKGTLNGLQNGTGVQRESCIKCR